MPNANLSLRRSGLLCCLLIFTSVLPSPAQTSIDTNLETRPNILFIAVDDLKPAIGAFGDVHAVTPHLDQLASRSTSFLNAHCQQAVCAPSRVSLMTGLRPDTTRVWDLKTRFRQQLPDVVTLPQRFKQAGYHSVGVGKIYDSRSTDNRKDMDAASWSEPYFHVDSPADKTYGYRNPETVARIEKRLAEIDPLPDSWLDQINAIFAPAGRPPTDRARVADAAYQDGAVTDLAVTKIGQLAKARQPFFFAVGYKKPHLPFNAPQRYWDLYDRESLPLAEISQSPRAHLITPPSRGGNCVPSTPCPKKAPCRRAFRMNSSTATTPPPPTSMPRSVS